MPPGRATPPNGFTVPIGASLLDVVRELRETGLHLAMTPGLVLRAWEDHGRDLTGLDRLHGRGGHPRDRRVDRGRAAGPSPRRRRGRGRRRGPPLPRRPRPRHRRRARAAQGGLLPLHPDRHARASSSGSGGASSAAGSGSTTAPSCCRSSTRPGQVALVDYTVGDTVAVPTAFAASGSERIAAITLTEGEDGGVRGDARVRRRRARRRRAAARTAATPSGQDCCGGAGGAGDKPGSGGGGGGGGGAGTTVIDTASTAPLVLTDFACEGAGGLAVDRHRRGRLPPLHRGRHDRVDRPARRLGRRARALPARARPRSRRLERPGRDGGRGLHEGHRAGRLGPLLPPASTARKAGRATRSRCRSAASRSSWRRSRSSSRASTRSCPTTPGSGTWRNGSITADPDDVPAPSGDGWAGEPAIAITTCRTDGSAITAGPAGYTRRRHRRRHRHRPACRLQAPGRRRRGPGRIHRLGRRADVHVSRPRRRLRPLAPRAPGRHRGLVARRQRLGGERRQLVRLDDRHRRRRAHDHARPDVRLAPARGAGHEPRRGGAADGGRRLGDRGPLPPRWPGGAPDR